MYRRQSESMQHREIADPPPSVRKRKIIRRRIIQGSSNSDIEELPGDIRESAFYHPAPDEADERSHETEYWRQRLKNLRSPTIHSERSATTDAASARHDSRHIRPLPAVQEIWRTDRSPEKS